MLWNLELFLTFEITSFNNERPLSCFESVLELFKLSQKLHELVYALTSSYSIEKATLPVILLDLNTGTVLLEINAVVQLRFSIK